MAGPQPAPTAPAPRPPAASSLAGATVAPPSLKQPARASLGPIGEAAQLVEAALQARTAASQGQKFATTKTLFFALSGLSRALRLELRLRDIGQEKPPSELRADCEVCASTLHDVLSDKKLEMTAPFCRSVGECFRQVFALCESLNAVGVVLDVHKLLENRKTSAEAKVAALDALGEISKAAELRVVSVLPESITAAAKQLKHAEPMVRVSATSALMALVDGAGGVGSSVHAEALKAAVKAAADRCPDVRVKAYKLCLSLAEAAPNLAAPTSPVPLEALVALCVRGLDDESPAARLAAAAATGAALSMGVEGSTAENERLGVIAARDQDQDDEQEGGGGGGGGGSGSSTSTKFANRLKEMGNEMKVGMTKLGEKKMPTLGDSLTPDKVVQFLSELFRRATFPSPTSREYMAGVAEAFVCLWKSPHMLARVNSSTVSKLVSCVLDLLDTDRLPQGAGETGVVRTAVEYIVREGVSAPLPELAQQLVAREMLQILAEVAGSAPPASGFPPLLNEHQIQVCLVELSHLTRALGQACAALKDTLAESLSALLAHPSYGVRFEAAVALASLGSALPWCAAGLLQQCLDEIQQQYDALMAEGILPASTPLPAPPSKLEKSVKPTDDGEGTGEGVGSGGEPDPDLELDDDVSAAGVRTAIASTVGTSDSSKASVQPQGIGRTNSAEAGGGSGSGASGGARGRSTVATKRLRLLLLHGNSAAASLLLQVARELPMGIPSKVAENSFVAAEKLILVQFPVPESQATEASSSSNPQQQHATAGLVSATDVIPEEVSHSKNMNLDEDSAEAAMERSSTPRARSADQKAAPGISGSAEGRSSRGSGGGGADVRQHPMGVVCTCVRTGWSLMSSLFCIGEEWAEGHAGRLMDLWALCMRGAEDGPAATRLLGLEAAHELILLDASTRALLWFLRSCPNTLCMVPHRISLAITLMESAVEAVEGRLKSPVKKQGVICRTLLKALLMECFAWLPPGSFPDSSARLFKWSLDHLKMYTLNDVQSSLLPELLNPDDSVLSVASTAKIPTMSGVGSLVEGEDLDTVLAQVTLVSGVTIGPQERDAMVCSADPWAGRGPSPARKRRQEENTPPTPLHANVGSSLSEGGWRRPLPSSASINVRLLDAAVQVFAASFGQQSNESKAEGISGLIQALPEYLQAAAAAAAANGSRGGAKKDASFTMPVLLSEEDRKKRERRHRIALLNVCATVLAALKSMPPLPDAGGGGETSTPRHNIDLPWVTATRDVLLELLSSGDSMIRRSAAESLALMGLKVGDGYAVYLVQDLLKILRKKPEKKKASEKDAALGANRRAGAMFALACLKRIMGGQVVLNWFWMDVQRELAVGGDVVQPVRTWGLHSISLLVKGLDAESNPTQYTEIQEMVKYLNGVVELLEAHFLGSWTAPTLPHSKRSSGASTSSAVSLREGQALCVDVPGLASALAELLCTLLPVLQALQPSRQMVSRFLAMWGILRHYLDSRVTHGCLELVELLAMFAPADVPDALPEIMPFVQGVLREGVGGTSPECLVRAAMCVKLVAGRAPEAVEGYRPELELYQCLESVLGSLTWEGAPTWRGVVISRDVERHFGVRVDAARQLEVAIETVVGVDQAGYRPLHWLLLGKALVVGTGHVQLPPSGGGEGGGGGRSSSGGALEERRISDWHGVVQAARNSLAMFASPLASSRWQVKRSAIRGCVMVLSSLQSGSLHHTDERVACLDVKKARTTVNKAIRALAPEPVTPESVLPPRPSWARVPLLLCLYLEDMVTLACAASTASTDDSELLELQEAGVMMLTEVARVFAQVPDSDEDELALVRVGGKSVKAPSLALELSISQITAAARPALGCKVSPRLAQRGCELVVTLVREGLVKDTVVLRRLVRQVMPEEVLALSAKQSGLEKSFRRSRASRSPSPRPTASASPGSSFSPKSSWGLLGSKDSAESATSPVGFGNQATDAGRPLVGSSAIDGGMSATASGGNGGGGMTAAFSAAMQAEAWSVRAAVEASLRPKESEVYGVHVPLAERAARLQCLAVLRLLAAGEDDARDGGGSGSGAIIPDSVKRGLIDALREHLEVLGLHWLASVKDAVRLNQGDASGLWPSATKRNTGAGLTYPPGVKPSFAKGPLKGRWPAMAAAAAAGLNRAVSAAAAGAGGMSVLDSEAAPFLLSVCVCGLLAAEEGLNRRRSAGSRRSSFSAIGRGYATGEGVGFGDGDEDEDEGQAAEDDSVMFLSALRCLLARPQLLGDPSVISTPQQLEAAPDEDGKVNSESAALEALEQQQPNKLHDNTPVTMVVRAIQILSAPPFLCTAAAAPDKADLADTAHKGRRGGGGKVRCPLRLQLCAISVLRVLLSGDGAKYVSAATSCSGVEISGRRHDVEGETSVEEENDDGPLALWDALMAAVMSAVRAVLPAAFEPFGEAGNADEDEKLPMAAEDETGKNVSNNSAAVLAAKAMIIVQQRCRQQERQRKVQEPDLEQDPHVAAATLTSLLPLLSKLPPLCPPPERPTALPALLLLSARVLGAASMLKATENGVVLGSISNPHHKAWRTGTGWRRNAGAGGAEVETEVGVSTTTPEACAAVEFVRSCVTEVWRHRDTGRAAAVSAVEETAAQGMGALQIDCTGDSAGAVGRRNRPHADGISAAPEDDNVKCDPTIPSEPVASTGVDGVDNGDGDDDDDWGDEDFQGADDVPPNTLDGAGVDDTGENGSADSAVVTGQVTEVLGESSPGDSGDRRDTTAAADSPDDKEAQGDQAGVIPPEIENVVDSKREGDTSHGEDAVVEEAGDEDQGADALPDVAADGDAGPGGKGISTDGGEEDPTATSSDVVVPSAADEVGKQSEEGDVAPAQSNTENDEQKSSSNRVPTLAVATASVSVRSEVTAASPANKEHETSLRNGIVADNADDGSCAAVAAGAVQKLPPPVPNASTLVQGMGNTLNKLLKYHLNTRRAVSSEQEGGICGGRHGSAEAIGAATEAWGAVALAVPSAAPSLASTLQSALSAPADDCSVAARLALFRGVGVTVKAAQEEKSSTGQMRGEAESRDPSAAASLLRLLVPYALAGLRIEVARAATAVGVGEAGMREGEPHEACLLEGVHIGQLALKTAPQSSHSALLGLLLPLYASILGLQNLPALCDTIGQALLHAARSSAAAFKEAVAYVGASERHALEGAVRTAMIGQRAGVAGGGASRGQAGATRASTRKLDLSQYKARG